MSIVKHTILVDEHEGYTAFAVCIHEKGADRFGVEEVGSFPGCNPEAVRNLQMKYGAKVEIDPLGHHTRLQAAAEHYSWKINKPKQGDFPCVGFIVNTAMSVKSVSRPR